MIEGMFKAFLNLDDKYSIKHIEKKDRLGNIYYHCTISHKAKNLQMGEKFKTIYLTELLGFLWKTQQNKT